jgi:hypothetical protein
MDTTRITLHTKFQIGAVDLLSGEDGLGAGWGFPTDLFDPSTENQFFCQ